MEFLKLLYLCYVDGYTFDHWPTIVWMISVNGMFVTTVLSAWLNYLDRRWLRNLHN